MSSKKLIAVLFALIAGALTPLSASAITLKIATLAPDGNKWMKQMRDGAKEIEQRTQGRVKFKYYPGGVMGSDKSVMRKIRIGQLHGGAVTSSALYDVYPNASIYTIPLLFSSYDEMNYVRKRMDKEIVAGIEKSGFVTFGLSDGGFAYLMSNEPVRTVAELQGKKVWVPEDDKVIMEVFGKMGVSAIPLPISDVYTGLQTGLIDTVGTSPIGAVAFQWHTKTKYLTDIPLIYLNGLMIVSKKAFSKIKPADQKVVREVYGKIFTHLNVENQKDNIAAKKALKNQGIQFVSINKNEAASMQKHIDAATANLVKQGTFSQKLLDSIKQLRASYRSKHQTASR